MAIPSTSESLENRYLFSAERNVHNMTFEEYLVEQDRKFNLNLPNHPYDGVNDEGVREYSVETERFLADEFGFMTPEEEFDIENHISPDTKVGETYMDRTLRDMRKIDEVSGKEAIEMTEEERMAIIENTFSEDFILNSTCPLEVEQAQDEIQMAVNPQHYKDIIPGYEYFDLMDYMLEGWKGSQGHALGNAYKYLMRLGKKDNDVQELGKAIWYLERLKTDLEERGKQ